MRRMTYACSAIVFHWAMDKTFDQLEQHNVFIAKNLKQGLKAIFKGGDMPDDFSFYLHSPAKTDSTAAPEGQDSVSIIVPVANMSLNTYENIEEINSKIKQSIFDRLKKEGVPDFGSHIKFEKVFTHKSWKE